METEIVVEQPTPEPVVEPVQEEVKVEEKKESVYRDLSEEEKEMLLAIFDKHNGNMTSMILDRECLFKGRPQISYYVNKYGFKDELVRIRTERAKEVMAGLQDSKILALQHAQKILGTRYQLLVTKAGVQVYDNQGEPVVVEQLPHYKEIKVAWEIIKTELGEPTSITKGNVTTDTSITIIGAKELADKMQDLLDDKETDTGDTPVS